MLSCPTETVREGQVKIISQDALLMGPNLTVVGWVLGEELV